jgi:glycosyltransferase involved in cell wall biosynthesis
MFGLGLYRFIPAGLRSVYFRCAHGISSALVAALYNPWRFSVERRERKPRRVENAEMVLIGLLSSTTGLGQGARCTWHRLEAEGVKVHPIDATGYCGVWGGLEVAAERFRDFRRRVGNGLGPTPPTIIIHLNPPLFQKVYFSLPALVRRNARIIAYWAWELDLIPPEWRRVAGLCDEVWVPSRFVAEAVLRRVPAVKVKIYPHIPYEAGASRAMPRWPDVAKRRKYGIPERHFCVGYSFSFSSSFARKNPIGVIRAFQEAFADKEDVSLLIRYKEGFVWPKGVNELTRLSEIDKRIVLLDADQNAVDMEEFYDLLDVYVSLHRSEGYGLTIAEAADRGIPVLATGWGLAEDIRARPLVEEVHATLVNVDDPQGIYEVKGARWAEPDVEDAKKKMIDLYHKLHEKKLERIFALP